MCVHLYLFYWDSKNYFDTVLEEFFWLFFLSKKIYSSGPGVRCDMGGENGSVICLLICGLILVVRFNTFMVNYRMNR